MRILFIGDIVGSPGVTFVRRALPVLIAREGIDLVIANAENAANGTGLTPSLYRRLREAGVDLVTLGDHIYKKAEIIATLEKDDHICKPANFPPDAPGREFALATARDGTSVAVFCLLGRTFMRSVDCPFRAADRVLAALAGQTRCIVVDVHAEATADKYLLGHHLKGRVSAVLGTHTHVPTADEQILPGGTAFISDVGMTGPYDSILGRRIDRVMSTTITFVPSPFDVATGDVRLGGAVVDVDPATGQSQSIRRLMLTEAQLDALTNEEPATDAQ
ncbi:MAG TPA: TIGR00282 family metallophosphoesterase [Gemmataceae bacterium]|nr:TIGR00282 family metallophosphoesterase [Gemmataceae bacterium]